MRIAVVTSLYPGPPLPYQGIFAERRWLGMRSRGHEVGVIQPLPISPGPLAFGEWAKIRDMPPREVRGDVEVRRPRYLHVPGFDGPNVKRFARAGLRALLEGVDARSAGPPDVVVADYAWPAAGIAPALAERGIPCVVNGRGSDVLLVAKNPGLRERLAAYLRAAGSWCAVSEDLVAAMDELAGRAGRGHLVPNGVDLEHFRPRDPAPARRELRLPPGVPLVLVVGHLIERKDPLLSLEAFRRGAPEGSICAFVGRGPLEGTLLQEVKRAGIGERIRLVGEVAPEALATWYAAGDLLLLTSRREGRPNVVLEALASGVPVLATAAGGTAELLRGFEERMLERERDPEALAAKMLAALLADPPSADELRALVEPLSWERGLDALERCLHEAVSERGAA